MHKTIEGHAAALADRIDTYRNSANGQVLVAIDGRSGVGKSTLARLLNRRLNAALVSGDDFYAGGVEVRSCAAKKLADVCIDRAHLRSVLQTLERVAAKVDLGFASATRSYNNLEPFASITWNANGSKVQLAGTIRALRLGSIRRLSGGAGHDHLPAPCAYS